MSVSAWRSGKKKSNLGYRVKSHGASDLISLLAHAFMPTANKSGHCTWILLGAITAFRFALAREGHFEAMDGCGPRLQ